MPSSDEEVVEEPQNRRTRMSLGTKGLKVNLFPGLSPSALKVASGPSATLRPAFFFCLSVSPPIRPSRGPFFPFLLSFCSPLRGLLACAVCLVGWKE